MRTPFDEHYPNIAWWTRHAGWIELGRDDYQRSMIRVLDIGGMLWEGDDEYATMGDAMEEAEAFIKRWREENGR
jgi:hypothetical protein